MAAKKARPGPDYRREAGEMLGFARGELKAAHSNRANPDVPVRKAAGDSQAAAEKALKAVIILENKDYEWTHDLEVLAREAPADFVVPATEDELIEVSDLMTTARHPDLDGPISEDEADRAISVGEAIVESAIAHFVKRGVDPSFYDVK